MIAHDKIIHFLGGFGIAAVLSPVLGPVVAFGAAFVVGAGKELYDMTGRGTPDRYDLLATVAGGAFGVGVSWSLRALLL